MFIIKKYCASYTVKHFIHDIILFCILSAPLYRFAVNVIVLATMSLAGYTISSGNTGMITGVVSRYSAMLSVSELLFRIISIVICRQIVQNIVKFIYHRVIKHETVSECSDTVEIPRASMKSTITVMTAVIIWVAGMSYAIYYCNSIMPLWYVGIMCVMTVALYIITYKNLFISY